MYLRTFFILAMLSALISPCVCGVKGRCIEMMSEACSSACWGKGLKERENRVGQVYEGKNRFLDGHPPVLTCSTSSKGLYSKLPHPAI